MRLRPFLTSTSTAVLLALFVGACHNAPDESVIARDAAPAAPPASGSTAATPDAASAQAAGDAGMSVARAFCADAYAADNPRLEKVCATADLFFPEGIAKRAGIGCGDDFDAALSHGRVSFDHDAAAHCLEMLRSGPAARKSEADTIFGRFPCDRVLLGLQAEGQPCSFSIECKDGLACEGYSVTNDGVCKKPPKAGAACVGQRFSTILNEATAEVHHPACSGDAWCDGKTCQAHVAAGKPCPGPLACGAGTSCVVGRCGPLGGEGAPCTTASDCVFNSWCNKSADGGTGACAAKRAAGAECTAADACKGRCDFPKSGGNDASKIGHCSEVCGSG
jgi:hypothetical protein